MAVDVVADLTVHSREPLSFLLVGVPPRRAGHPEPAAHRRNHLRMSGAGSVAGLPAPEHIVEDHHVALYAATALIGVAGIALSRQRIRAETGLVRARSVAEAMQRALLRPFPRRIGPVRAAGSYEAGEGGTLVGARPHAHVNALVRGVRFPGPATGTATRSVAGPVTGSGGRPAVCRSAAPARSR